METSETMTALPSGELAAALAAAMAAVGGVEEKGQNKAQGWTFVSMGQIAATLRARLGENGVAVLPSILSTEEAEVKSSRGAAGYRVLVRMAVTFIHRSGEQWTVQTIGEGIDYGDKATGKAITSALKNALKMVFLFYAGEDDPDNHTVEAGERTSAPRQTGTRSAPAPSWKQANRYLRGVLSELDGTLGEDTVAAFKRMCGAESLKDVDPGRIVSFTDRLDAADDLKAACEAMVAKYPAEEAP